MRGDRLMREAALLPAPKPRRIGRRWRVPRSTSVETKEQAKEILESSSVDPHKPLLLVDIDGVISLFGGDLTRQDGLFPLDRGHSPLPFGHRRRSPARAGRAFRAGLVQRLGGEGRRAPAPPARAAGRPAVPALRPLGRPQQRALEARRDRRLRRRERALAWIDDALQRGCHDWASARAAPTLLVATEPAARPHRARGRAAAGVGAGAGAAAERRSGQRERHRDRRAGLRRPAGAGGRADVESA